MAFLGSRTRRRSHRVVHLLTCLLLVGLTQVVTAGPASAGQVGVTISVRGAGKVTVVEGSIEDGGSTTCDWSSQQDDRVTKSCPRIRNEEVFEAWVWLRATPSSFPAGNWSFSGWTGCDTTRVVNGFTECGVHSGAVTSDERTPLAIFDDTVGPTVTSVSAIVSTSMEKTYFFSFSTNESGQASCRFDGGTWTTPCSSGFKTFSNEGLHTFDVRGIDSSGNIGATSTQTVMVVDTAITGGPSGLVNGRNASFTVSSGVGTSYKCSLDNAAYSTCPTSSPMYSGLADGSHTFRVYAENGAFRDGVPAVRTWTIDATPPSTDLTSVVISGSNADFAYTHNGTGNGYECRLEGPGRTAGWESCGATNGYTGLVPGSYTFSARSIDAAGNVDPTPASYTWTVAGSAPNTTFVSGPAQDAFVASTSAAFRFAASVAGATLGCTLDGVAIACPDGTLSLTNLTHVTHSVTAAATESGQTDSTPVKRTWTVPLGSTELTRGTGWVKKTATNSYLGTYLQTSTKGATLSRSVTGARKIALVATKGVGFGSVQVFAGTTLLSTVSLNGTTTQTKRIIPVKTFSTPYTGTIRIVVSTSGKVVRLEGLGVATTP